MGGWQRHCIRIILFLLSKIPFPNAEAHILYLPPESGHHLPSIPPSMTSHELLHAAKEWARLDPNPETSIYVQNLVARVEVEGGDDIAFRELDSLFASGRIQFGTAGLRGPMEPGPSGMNDLVVIQSAQGLARYILDTNGGNTHLRAVVGYDHRSNSKFNRSISSKIFAMYTKLVFEYAGIECTLLDGFVPTPIVSYAVKSLDAAVGIMVTASHNPKQDNGYKVYWSDGCQIRSPMDAGIANEIVKDENLVPWIDYGKQLQLQKLKVESDGECFGLSDPTRTKCIEDAYFQSIISSGVTDAGSTGMNGATHNIISQPQFAYTAMHGVGCPYARRSFQAFNIPPFLVVPSQEKPDPDFPTVPFPNPEEKGALDRAMSFATENKCDIVLANDPDADRLGVAEFDKNSGEWAVFTGDQIGTLLGHWLWDTIGKTSDKVSQARMAQKKASGPASDSSIVPCYIAASSHVRVNGVFKNARSHGSNRRISL
jgi:phosphomannomutase